MLDVGVYKGSDAFDPRSKALVYVLGSTMVLLATHRLEFLALVVVQSNLLLVLQLGGRWLAIVRTILPTLALFCVVTWLSAGGGAALSATLRLLMVVTAGLLFFATTPPEELGDALVASGLSPQVAFLFEGTVRFVPTLGRLVHEVREALVSRGLRFDGLYLLRNGPLLLAPVLVSALHFADDLAEALEARGFGSPHRTPLRDYRFQLRDWLLMATTSVLALMCWFIFQ